MTVALHFAPIRGITTNGFYAIFSGHFGGVDSAVAPFVRPGVLERQRKFIYSEVNDLSSCRFPVTPQLLAGNERQFIETASLFFDAGYHTVNWNLGCPYPMVTKKTQGAGLLPCPDKVVTILDNVMPQPGGRLSIKTRLGLESPTELPALLQRLAAYDISEIMIHGRTAKQMYSGAIHIDSLQECVSLSPFPTVVNGDINSVSAFDRIRAACPNACGVMVGRGLLRNPYLAQQIKGEELPTVENRRASLRRFHDVLFDHYRGRLSGGGHLLQKMIAHWEYFADWFADSAVAYKMLRKTKSISAYSDTVDKLFGEFALDGQGAGVPK